MTRGTTPPLIDEIENGVTLVHVISFQFDDASEIVCTRIPAGGVESAPLAQGGDYSVTGGAGAGGTVTKTSAGVNGTVFRIRRVTTRAQNADFATSRSFSASALNSALDRNAQVDEEQDMGLTLLEGRTVRAPAGDSIAELPAAATRLSKFVQFAADGKSLLLLSASALAQALAAPIALLLGAVNKGDPGANVMAIGLFIAAPALSVPLGTDLVQTSGFAVAGAGHALYVADAAVDAAWVAAHPDGGFVTANGRGFRLSFGQQINIQMFGAVGDWDGVTGTGVGVTDNLAAFNAAIAFVKATASNIQNGTLWKGGASLYVPAPKAKGYFVSGPVEVKGASMTIEGPATQWGLLSPTIRFADNSDGFILHSTNTIGHTVEGGAGSGADICGGLRGLNVVGGGASLTCRGVWRRIKAFLEDIHISSFGYGDYMNATSGGGGEFEGNCNGWSNIRVRTASNRVDGAYRIGADVNTGSSLNGQYDFNGGLGLNDNGFLGSTYIADQATTNTAGPYATTNPNARHLFLGCYSEGDQPASSFIAPTMVLGGFHGAGVVGSAAYVSSALQALMATAGLRLTGNNPSFQGPAGLELYTVAGTAIVSGFDRNAGAEIPLRIGGSTVSLEGITSVPVLINAVTVGTWSAAGLNIAAGKTINFAGLTNAADDAGAAAAGVPVGSVYRNGSVLMVRIA